MHADSILSCTVLLPLDLNLFSSALFHKQQLCGAAFGGLECTLLSFFLIKTGVLLVAFVYLGLLINKRNKDSFVSSLQFSVAVKPDKLGKHGKGPICLYCAVLCVFVCTVMMGHVQQTAET